LTIKKSAGDGNCLFRSISDQLYGDEKYYDDIRKLCMDYIEHEKIFFQDYVAGDIEEYIEKKRRDGEWGDDIEIQAISEIYARPIEIYAFESKPIRTFHE
jgi:OTU domain-containing protein 5